MEQIRRIKTTWKSKPVVEGAGVRLKRAFGYYEVPRLDPFLLFDDFHSNDPSDYIAGFPWHPHRGIETITYVLDGRVEHGDSMGNKGEISAGDVQWMTAGSGIIHQEMPKGGPDKNLRGYQLWANLPASNKMMEPRYRDVKNSQIPVIKLDTGAAVRIICGQMNGSSGPVKDIVIDPEYLDVSAPPNSAFRHRIKPGHRVFAYTMEGSAYFDDRRDPYDFEVVGANYFDTQRECRIIGEHIVLYEDDGGHIEVTTDKEPVRFLLISGKPIGEPVAWYGPIVMNTQEELKTAFEEYRKGTFIKQKGELP